MNYDYDFFIAHFKAIPDDQWRTGDLESKHQPGIYCALGHCGMKDYHLVTPMAVALGELLAPFNHNPVWYRDVIDIVWAINDNGGHSEEFPPHISRCETPKARILAALYDAKARAEAALDAYELRELTLTPAKEQVGA